MQPDLSPSNAMHLRQIWQQVLALLQDERKGASRAQVSGLPSVDISLALAIILVSAISPFKTFLVKKTSLHRMLSAFMKVLQEPVIKWLQLQISTSVF